MPARPQGLSQELETVCPKLLIVKFLGVLFFLTSVGRLQFTQITRFMSHLGLVHLECYHKNPFKGSTNIGTCLGFVPTEVSRASMQFVAQIWSSTHLLQLCCDKTETRETLERIYIAFSLRKDLLGLWLYVYIVRGPII